MADEFVIDDSIGTGRRSPMESGRVIYAVDDPIPATVNIRGNLDDKRLIARLENAQPVPVALHVRGAVGGAPFDFGAMAQQTDWATNLTGERAGLMLIVDYGDLTGRHRVVADWRSGIYQLPACTFCQVYSLFWDPGAVALFPWEAAAAFSRGLVTMPRPMTYTVATTLAPATSRTVFVPDYTQFVDVWADSPSIALPNAADIATTIGIFRNYAAGFVPPWGPVSWSGDSLNQDAFDVTNNGAAAVRVTTQFYLAL